MLARAEFNSQIPSRRQRRLKNLLLDRGFQLKYSAYFCATALIVGVGLGVVLWRTSGQVISQSRASVALGEHMVLQGEDLIRESEKVNSVVRMSIVEAYADNPALLEMFQGEATRHDKLLGTGQREIEDNRRSLAAYAIGIEQQHRKFALILSTALCLFVLTIGLLGILVTHKVAGPIHKMQRLLWALGQGHFRITARLRRGDELTHFFDAFNRTADSLRMRQEHELREISAALAELRSAVDGPPDLLAVKSASERLQRLREGMATSLATVPPGT
jgi:nitrogen fixation/metabolism regulation signal transduction histidine kinase